MSRSYDPIGSWREEIDRAWLVRPSTRIDAHRMANVQRSIIAGFLLGELSPTEAIAAIDEATAAFTFHAMLLDGISLPQERR